MQLAQIICGEMLKFCAKRILRRSPLDLWAKTEVEISNDPFKEAVWNQSHQLCDEPPPHTEM